MHRRTNVVLLLLVACSGGLPLVGDDAGDGSVSDVIQEQPACDANTLADPANCGACNNACSVPSGAIATCNVGVCGFQCQGSASSCGSACVDLQTTSKNCGICGRDCLGASCVAGKCAPTILATSPTAISDYAIAVDATYVYWGATNAIYRVVKTGGSVEPVTTALSNPPGVLVTDGTTIYFTVPALPYTNGAIDSIPVDGGAGPVTLYPNQTFGNGTTNLAMDSANLYWASNGNGVTPSSINQAPRSGGGPVTLLAANPNYPQAIAVDSTTVYWVNYNTFAKVPIDGGTVVPLGQTQVVGNIAVGANVIALGQYYGNSSDAGVIGLYALDGSAIATSFVPAYPFQVAMDSSYVYASTIATITAVPLDGGASVDIGVQQPRPFGVVTDATRVYWLNGSDNTIRSTPKL